VKNLHLTGLLQKEGNWYCSHCPELGVASQGQTVEEAITNLKEAVELFLECASESEIETRYNPEIIITRFDAAYA
jgi:predicted RNase H-like HicB family nuclease